MGGRVLYSQRNTPQNGSYDSPVRGQLTVHNNKVLCTRFRDQKFDPDFVFPATRLPGAKDPPNVLRPEDLARDNSNHFGNFRGRGRGGGRGFNPRMGFNERRDQASLGDAGHRMLGHHVRRGGAYDAVPPPLMGAPLMAQQERHSGGRGGGFNQNRGNFGNNQRGYNNHHSRGGYNQHHRDNNYHNRNDRGGGYNHHNRGHNQNSSNSNPYGSNAPWMNQNSGQRGSYRGGGQGHNNYGQHRGGGNNQDRGGRSGGGGYYTSSYQGNR